MAAPAARAGILFYEAALFIDGDVHVFSTPGDVGCPTCTGALNNAGLGAIEASIIGAGNHRVGLYLDYEIDEGSNSFFNEYGLIENANAAAPGLSFEIDEPGFFFGDIFDNFNAGSLDNTNALSAAAPDDTAMALMWDFSLNDGQSALVSFFITDIVDAAVFGLTHRDVDSPDTIFFTSSLTVSGGVAQIPAPAAGLLFASVLFLPFLRRRRREKATH